MSDMRIRTRGGVADRCVVVGQTRSGKSVLCGQLAAPAQSCVVVDSKHEEPIRLELERQGYVVTSDARDIARHAKVLYRPPALALSDRKGWESPGRPGWEWTVALRAIWWRGSSLVRFLECLEVMPARGGHPEVRKLITQGAARDIAMLLETQAPLYVDPMAFSQSQHCFAFRTAHAKYRQLISEQRGVGCDVLAELEQYAFAGHSLGSDEWTLFEPLPLGARKDQSATVKKPTLSEAETPGLNTENANNVGLTATPDAGDGAAV